MDILLESIRNIFGKSKLDKLVEFIEGKTNTIDVKVMDSLLECYEKNDRNNINKMNSFFMLNNNFYNLCVHLTTQKKNIQLKIFALVRKLNNELLLSFPEEQTDNFIKYLLDDKENQYCSLSLLEILLDDSAFYQEFVGDDNFIMEIANGIDNDEFDIQTLYLSILYKLLNNNFNVYLFKNPKREIFFDKLMNRLDKSNIYVKNRIANTIFKGFINNKEAFDHLAWFVEQKKYYDIALKYLIETTGQDLIQSFDLYKLFIANPNMPEIYKESFSEEIIKNVVSALAVYSCKEPDISEELEIEAAIIIQKMRDEIEAKNKEKTEAKNKEKID